MRLLRLFRRGPFFGLVVGGVFTAVVLCRGGWTWRGWSGWRLYDKVGASLVIRLGPLVLNYLPLRHKGAK